jgi:hypothetical protein
MSHRTRLGIALLCVLGALIAFSTRAPSNTKEPIAEPTTVEETTPRAPLAESTQTRRETAVSAAVPDLPMQAPKHTVPSFAPAVRMERVIETHDGTREQRHRAQAQRAKVLNARLERHLAQGASSP